MRCDVANTEMPVCYPRYLVLQAVIKLLLLTDPRLHSEELLQGGEMPEAD